MPRSYAYSSREDSYAAEPVGPSSARPYAYDSPSRQPLTSSYDYPPQQSSPPSQFADGSPPYRSRRASRGPPLSYEPYRSQYRSAAAAPDDEPPAPPPHGDRTFMRGPPAHGEHMAFSESSSSLSAGPGYGNASDTDSVSQVPPPPSRAMPGGAASNGGGYIYGAHNASPMRSQANSLNSYGYANDPYGDDYHGIYSASTRSIDQRLGQVNPNEIEDDGDDGLNYSTPRHSQRNSMLGAGTRSNRPGRRAAAGAAGAGALGGFLGRGRQDDPGYDLATGAEKGGSRGSKKEGLSKRAKWAIMIGVLLFFIGVIVAGVVGGMVANGSIGGGGGNADSAKDGDSAKDDQRKNGDLDADSDEIKELLNNPDLHKVFPGMDYTPLNAQYPDCLENPPSQNNITRDMAVLSQLTNKVRLYGTDCNQTQMVIHAIDRLNLKDDVKVWLGVWQDDNDTTSARQLDQMWTILDDYGDEPFEGLIIANEILFREEMTITQLGNLLDNVRSNLTDRNMNLPVATSDLGDDWTQALADSSDYIMANIHPFFAGEPAKSSADWTMKFWKTHNGPFFKTDTKKNIISETGWPTAGGTSCGNEYQTDCPDAAVASIDGLNEFLEGWVCPALRDGTNYFWFSAFDEPWKIRYNEDGKEWEDKWGLMDVNRNLKKGVKIPDCGGSEVS